MSSNSHNPCLPKDPDFLLSLKFIPPHLLRYIPPERRPGQITKRQTDAIRGILNMRKDQKFKRCRGKNRKFVQKCEENGDMSHSDKRHLCPECQCTRIAGKGLKGDFYGLGPETGPYGVGYCYWCYRAMHLQPGTFIRNCRIEIEMLQSYGEAKMDSEEALKIANCEVSLAKDAVKAREEVQLVRDELARFMKLLKAAENKEDLTLRPTRYVKGELVPLSDLDILNALQDSAKTLSRLNIDGLKLDASKYILVDYVLEAAGEIQRAVDQAMMKMEELIVAKQVRGEEIETDEPIRDYVSKLFRKDWALIWLRIKQKIGKQVG